MTVYVLRLLLAIIIIYWCGNVLLRMIDNRKLYTGWLERASVAFPMGIFVVALIQLYMLYVRIPLGMATTLSFLSPFIVVQIYYYLKSLGLGNRQGKVILAKRVERHIIPGNVRMGLSFAEWLIICYLTVLCLIICFSCIAMPTYAWDERGTWLLYSKVFFYQKTIFTTDFLDPYRFMLHHNYPLLVSLAVNFFYTMLGKADDYLGKILFGLFYIDFVIFFYIIQKKFLSIPRLGALIFAAVFMSVPCYFKIFNGSVISAYADFPLSCFYLLTVAHLIAYSIKPQRTLLFISAIFASACIFTKKEGAVLYLFSLSILVGEGLFRRYFGKRAFWQNFLVYVVLPSLLLIPWFLIRRGLPSLDDQNPLLYGLTLQNAIARVGNFSIVFKHTLSAMFLDCATWGIIWAVIIFSVILYLMLGWHSYGNPRIIWYLLIIPLAYYIFVSFMYVFCAPYANFPLVAIPIEYEFKQYPPYIYNGGASFARLRMHVLPLLFLFVSLQISSLFHKQNE